MSNNRADDAPRKELKLYNPDELIIIGHDTDDGPTHTLFDAESNAVVSYSEAEIQFTYEYGVIEPVACKRDGKRLLLVFGRGRTRKLREANKRRIKDGLQPWLLSVQIVLGDAAKLLALKNGENGHRRVQNPVARAKDAYDMMQQMPEEKVATIMGVSVKQLRQNIKLLSLAPAVTKELLKGTMSAAAAAPLANLSEAEQVEQLAEILAGGSDGANGAKKKPTERDVKSKLREAAGKAPILTPSQRIGKVLDQITKIDETATKDDLWTAIHKIQKMLTTKPAVKKAITA